MNFPLCASMTFATKEEENLGNDPHGNQSFHKFCQLGDYYRKPERSFIADHGGNLQQTHQFVCYKKYHKFELIIQLFGVNR